MEDILSRKSNFSKLYSVTSLMFLKNLFLYVNMNNVHTKINIWENGRILKLIIAVIFGKKIEIFGEREMTFTVDYEFDS